MRDSSDSSVARLGGTRPYRQMPGDRRASFPKRSAIERPIAASGRSRLLEDAVFGELLALALAETQQLFLDPVVVLAEQRPGPVVARRTARHPKSVALIRPLAHRGVRERHEVLTVQDL